MRRKQIHFSLADQLRGNTRNTRSGRMHEYAEISAMNWGLIVSVLTKNNQSPVIMTIITPNQLMTQNHRNMEGNRVHH